MQKKYIHIFFVCISIAMLSCTKDSIEDRSTDYVTIPDPIFEKELIELGIDSDGIVNKKLLKTDAASIDRLVVFKKGIANFKGIEAFTNLKRLYASYNNATQIDLSANTELDTLDLSANALTTIDLSANIKLKKADLYDNLLTEVTGLSNNHTLTYLSLSSNYLTSFTLKNSSLKHLLIDNNDLVSFDASLAVNLKTLVIYTNKLQTINLTSNTKLEVLRVADNKITDITFSEHKELYYLSISDNLLTNMDVSIFPKLAQLYGHRNPNLKCIKIHTNQDIPTLSLSNYQQLKVDCN